MHIIHITRIIDIIYLIHITTIFRIVVCFHHRHKCTVEGLGPSVCLSRGREQEQDSGIPDCFRQPNKSSIVDCWRPNYDRVQSVTAVERFGRKRVAVYPARGSQILLRLQQEDHISHRREPLPMNPNTGIECTIMRCIICIMHIKRKTVYTEFNSNNENKRFNSNNVILNNIMLHFCRIRRLMVKIMSIIVSLNIIKSSKMRKKHASYNTE
jgi:hypothetical protein